MSKEVRGTGPIPENIDAFMKGRLPATEMEVRLYQYAQRCCASIDYLILQEEAAQEKAKKLKGRIAQAQSAEAEKAAREIDRSLSVHSVNKMGR